MIKSNGGIKACYAFFRRTKGNIIMKKVIKVVGIIIAAVLIGIIVVQGFYFPKYLSSKKPIELPSVDDSKITVMSSNVRCYSPNDLFKKSWFYRAGLVRENLSAYTPDIVGFQEVTWLHYGYLQKVLEGYDSVIEYRDNSSMSEGCPIFYRKDKFELVDKGSFWLSETPEKMSKDWGAACYRVCSYVILKEISTQKELVVFNTHLDHVSDEARVKGIAVVLDKIQAFGDKPSIFMGDMNAKPNSVTYNNAVESFDDAKVVATDTMDGATYQAWGKKLNHERIDYFLVSKTGIEVEKYAVVQNTYDGVYPSDHFPIYLEMKLD